MARKNEFDYFEAYRQQAHCCTKSAMYLQKTFKVVPIVNSKTVLTEMHEIENEADNINHEIQMHLSSDFVVPLERENMVLLANSLDDVEDALEDIAIRLYIFNIDSPTAAMADMTDLLVEAVAHLNDALAGLKHRSRKVQEIREALIGIHSCENRCDEIYIETVRELYISTEVTGEQRQIIHKVYDTFEKAMDTLEMVAEDIESIVAQNL